MGGRKERFRVDHFLAWVRAFGMQPHREPSASSGLRFLSGNRSGGLLGTQELSSLNAPNALGTHSRSLCMARCGAGTGELPEVRAIALGTF